MTIHAARTAQHDLPEAFRDSVLGLYLDDYAAPVFTQGRLSTLQPGQAMVPAGEGALHVLLHGRLSGKDDWYGPGNHFDDASAEGLAASGGPAMLWTIETVANAWLAAVQRPARLALARALIAADTAELAARPPVERPNPTTLCDLDHPAIRRQAVRLRRATPASTAKAIFHFVQVMPYRFGHWHERASETLARGVGMCTTKANLQVALMRAAGLEAGFVETPMPMSKLGRLMPDGWLALMRNEVRHYFAAVKLGGRWHAADASYDEPAFRIYIESMPELGYLLPAWLDEGRPYHSAAAAKGDDPWDITVVPDLNDVMGKQSRFGPRHFEALNTRVDRARGAQRRIARGEDGELLGGAAGEVSA
ncbi:MAG: transglutaminase family protein [Pararhodobacter sp.]|nr:transglutaminase family protein [Pararhodobacter sp.]